MVKKMYTVTEQKELSHPKILLFILTNVKIKVCQRCWKRCMSTNAFSSVSHLECKMIESQKGSMKISKVETHTSQKTMVLLGLYLVYLFPIINGGYTR